MKANKCLKRPGKISKDAPFGSRSIATDQLLNSDLNRISRNPGSRELDVHVSLSGQGGRKLDVDLIHPRIYGGTCI